MSQQVCAGNSVVTKRGGTTDGCAGGGCGRGGRGCNRLGLQVRIRQLVQGTSRVCRQAVLLEQKYGHTTPLTLHLVVVRGGGITDVVAVFAAVELAAAAAADTVWPAWCAAVCADAGADAFVLPMIVGSISQLSDVEASAHGKSVR